MTQLPQQEQMIDMQPRDSRIVQLEPPHTATLFRSVPASNKNTFSDAIVISWAADSLPPTVDGIKVAHGWSDSVEIYEQPRGQAPVPMDGNEHIHNGGTYFVHSSADAAAVPFNVDEKAVGFAAATVGAFIAAVVKNHTHSSSEALWIGVAGVAMWFFALFLYVLQSTEWRFRTEKSVTIASAGVVTVITGLNILLAAVSQSAAT